MKRTVFAVLVLFVAHGLVADVSLSVTNREAVARNSAPVTGGVPFPRGAVSSIVGMRLLRDGTEIPAQFLVTARWSDDSIRWVLVDSQLDLGASATVPLTLATGTLAAPVSGITFSDAGGTLTVNTGSRQFTFNKSEFLPNGVPFEVTSGGTTYTAKPLVWTIEESGPMKLVIRVDGPMLSNSGASLVSNLVRFRARLTFHRNRSDARVAITLRNNGGFNWEGSQSRGDDVILSAATFGTTLLPNGTHTFGPGVEKTWHLQLPASGSPQLRDTRHAEDGRIAPGYATHDALIAAQPQYYASTKAWGTIGLPVIGSPLQAEFDRFEKMQRAKVIGADLENPPNTTGITLWNHLARDLASWNDYGDLRWDGNGCGTLSGNHYDWSYGMYLQFMRTGRLEFADAARVFAVHEIDFDVYHTADDGAAYNYQKNWEDRPSHDTPDNCFGGGRPTHTWTQGYALHWLLTGDRRGLDAFNELQEGIRQYLYESFIDEGHVNTNEIRTQGWIVDNLVARWRLEPKAVIETPYGNKSITAVLRDVLQNVFEREQAAGRAGFVYASAPGDDENSPDANLRAPLQNAYFVEPAIKAWDEVFRYTDSAFGNQVLSLARRMTDFLMSITYGGNTNASGDYRPRQIPYFFDARESIEIQQQGQVVYLLMSANAAGYFHSQTGEARYREYARNAFRDYVRYVGVAGGDSYVDPAARTPASYNSTVFTGTESKIHGWSSRYGQFFLASEQPAAGPVASPRRRSAGR